MFVKACHGSANLIGIKKYLCPPCILCSNQINLLEDSDGAQAYILQVAYGGSHDIEGPVAPFFWTLIKSHNSLCTAGFLLTYESGWGLHSRMKDQLSINPFELQEL